MWKCLLAGLGFQEYVEHGRLRGHNAGQLPDAGLDHVCRGRHRGHVQGQFQVPIIMMEVLNECSIL